MYRCAQYYPDLVSHLFTVCTPYNRPQSRFISLQSIVERVPQFGYQLHLAGPDVEAEVKGEQKIRAFLNGMYGGRTPDKKRLFDPVKGIRLDLLDRIGKSPLLSERELDYYVQQYCRNGMHGTREYNAVSLNKLLSTS